MLQNLLIFHLKLRSVKKGLSILMTLIVLLPTLSKVWIYADFKINQDYIAEVFCVNKDEPMTMCYGSCYLTAEMQKTDDTAQNQQAPANQKNKVEINYFVSESTEESSEFSELIASSKTCRPQSQYHSDFLSEIFKPPQLV